MVIFTYNDYLDCIASQKIQKAMHIEGRRIQMENTTKEKQKSKQTINIQDEKIDEIIENLIEQKGEIVDFINDFFKIQAWEVTKKNLEHYKNLHTIESKIYKLKEKEIYFFIKLQKEPNYHMPYIILTECMNFIQTWKQENQNSKQPPIIVPIVIYIGKQNWNCKPNSSNMRYTSFEENRINLAYNLIDLNRCKPIELIKKKSLISNIMIIKSNIDNLSKKKLLEKLKDEIQEIDKYLQISEIERILLTKWLGI